MKLISPAAIAAVLGLSLAACSSATSSSTSTTTDTTTTTSSANDATSGGTDATTSSTTDTTSTATNASAAPAGGGTGVNGVAIYPGATESSTAGSMGTPPPDGKAYVTGDSLAKVKAWYLANVPGIKAMPGGDDKQGTVMIVGDEKTGTAVLLVPGGGKTYIGMAPANSQH